MALVTDLVGGSQTQSWVVQLTINIAIVTLMVVVSIVILMVVEY